jgi:two-component system sensor histidine kinase QseC
MIQDLAPIAALKNIDLSFEGADGLIVMADKTQLRLLIGNVIAVKYAPDNGKVDVTLSSDAESIICTVSDSRPGIPEEEREHVLQRFYRMGTPQVQGTGLALAVVAETAARLSGKISLKTPESGQGLPVEISLPRAHAVAGT